MLTRTLLLAAAGSLTLAAQPQITIRPAPDQVPQGITIVTPADPSFQRRVETILPPIAVPLYQHLLPYSILIRNEPSAPIIAMMLTIRITDTNGHTSPPQVGRFEILPGSRTDPVLVPGQDFLITPDARFTQLAPNLRGHYALNARLDELANRPLERYLSAREIALSFDSFLLADGTLKGPDEENSFDSWTKMLHERARFDKAALAFDGRTTEELRSYLATVAATPMRHSHGVQNDSELAAMYERLLSNKGPDVVFSQLKANLKEVAALNIHR